MIDSNYNHPITIIQGNVSIPFLNLGVQKNTVTTVTLNYIAYYSKYMYTEFGLVFFLLTSFLFIYCLELFVFLC